MFFVHSASRLSHPQVQVLHAADIVWTSVLTFVSEGPVSPFFLFFLFVVLAAAFRWAFRETLLTAMVIVAVFLTETVVAAAGPWSDLFAPTVDDLNAIVLRAAYLLITGVLLGYLAEQDKRSRAELAAIADIARQPRIGAGIGGTMNLLGQHLLRVLGARLIAVVLHDHERGRTNLWLIRTGDVPAADEAEVPAIELDAAQREAWLFNDGGGAWLASLQGAGLDVVRVAVPGSWPLVRREMVIPAPLRSLQSPGPLLAMNFGLPVEWTGRVYVFNPATLRGERAVHLLASMIDHVTPAISNLFLTRRLRLRAGLDERARVARELHDGAIQSLFGLEMKIEALRRAAGPSKDTIDATLGELQLTLRQEVQALRDLMQALRPIEIDDGQQLQEVVSSIVERFRRDSGIAARFVASGSIVNLAPATAIEAVRIVQEALVNVRKHSGGQNVLVRIESIDDRHCRLTVEDDGRGFDFDGRMTASELDRAQLGPAIIRERARMAKAELIVESLRGRGSRVELTFGTAAG
jgi:signal transduction histidine kinase